MKLRQITRRAGREPLNALAIDSRTSLVSLDFVPRGFEGRRSIDLIHQTEPLASFDAVTQRRHHTIRSVQIVASAHHSPWRSPPAASLPCVALTALSEFCCVIPELLASNFLPPFPRSGFASRPSHRSKAASVL